mmetsp:Transcript_39039/g.89716  ORF Transcript_39039/g.89716 Transcript_39039/m.89716 type:complete len:245 (+) Transcript_39039:446-1180(+)
MHAQGGGQALVSQWRDIGIGQPDGQLRQGAVRQPFSPRTGTGRRRQLDGLQGHALRRLRRQEQRDCAVGPPRRSAPLAPPTDRQPLLHDPRLAPLDGSACHAARSCDSRVHRLGRPLPPRASHRPAGHSSPVRLWRALLHQCLRRPRALRHEHGHSRRTRHVGRLLLLPRLGVRVRCQRTGARLLPVPMRRARAVRDGGDADHLHLTWEVPRGLRQGQGLRGGRVAAAAAALHGAARRVHHRRR